MGVPTAEQVALLNSLGDTVNLLQKTQTNLKKCPKQRLTPGYIKARLNTIEDYWENFTKINTELLKCTPREQRGTIPYFLNEEYFIYEDLYISMKADLTDLLTGETSLPKPKLLEESSASSTGESSIVKLPRIELPAFSGKYEEWPTFKDLFTALVHNNTSLSDVQRLHYLKTSVKGEAEALLKHIQVTDKNYSSAWEILTTRFGNKRMIVNSILKRLYNQKKFTSQTASQIKSLLDTTTDCLNSLQNQNINTDTWDPLIIFLVVQKLDTETHKEWEETIYSEGEELPKWDELKKFLNSKYRTLELVNPPTMKEKQTFHVTKKNTEETNLTRNCTLCHGNHFIFNCERFIAKPTEERINIVKNKRLCFNCLVPNHMVFRCRKNTTCRICRRRHHSLLHEEKQREEQNTRQREEQNTKQREDQNTKEREEYNTKPREDYNTKQREEYNTKQREEKYNTKQREDLTVRAHMSRESPNQPVLLATALVNVMSKSGEQHVLRALVDQGSEATFITARTVELLGMEKKEVNGVVSGVGDTKNKIRYSVDFAIKPKTKCTAPVTVHAYVLKSISSRLPSTQINVNWPLLHNIALADPQYDTPGRIDLLLGVDVYSKIIEDGLKRGPGGIIAQKTTLGWILSGQTNEYSQTTMPRLTSLHITQNVSEDNELLKKFWEIEEAVYTKRKGFTKEEELCEEIYKKTTIRDKMGRYIVELPLKQSIEETVKFCGETKTQAITRFNQLERRFEKNYRLKEEYTRVMKEYINLGHMKKVEDGEDNRAIYLLHHAVIREDKSTTKLRVVFDASAKGSQGHSLNDAMMVGPVLQPDLRTLVIRWRTHKVCVVGDIVKMYRAVTINEKHTDLQRIVWRDNKNDKIESYKLLTVTFGMGPAPFLAVRTLHQLADDEAKEFPETSNLLKNSFYIDDFMHGNGETEKAKRTCMEIKEIFKRGGFEMQKWSSNSDALLEELREKTEDTDEKEKLEIKFDNVVKILGLQWDRKRDIFTFTINLPEIKNPVTKRTILSDVARLFDPFGWLSPVVIVAKVLIQKLWLCNIGWDDEPPQDLIDEWKCYRYQLLDLKNIEVPRWLHTSSENKYLQLHGFSDASITAYAAVVYLKAVTKNNEVYTTIIASKTKVAPLKQLSIPKLELCAAALLAELIDDIANLLNISKSQIYAWTDSMVVLSWLQSQPSRWKTFVANRVADTIRLVNPDRWRHVQSIENPADIATRGAKACDMATNELWWTGPVWLQNKEVQFERIEIPKTDVEERKTMHTKIVNDKSIWEKFSTLSKMKRVLAYCRRMKKEKNRENYLTPNEMERVVWNCIKFYQNLVYEKEIEGLKKEGKISRKSKLATLAPFLDKNGMLRVGGRLNNANLEDDAKHPIIIPSSQHITYLLVQEAHIKTLHGGVLLMSTYLRNKYWIINMKSAIKKCIRNCKICVLDKAKTRQQIMGQLPVQRVQPSRAFFKTGVDYAGPIQLRISKGRGHKTTKGYICLFVCMATRAIHLEVVSDLTSQAFIAAFRRFVARRGRCAHLWSDNGTNFVGAAKELKQLFKKAISHEVAESLANDGTTFHFIPPRMPNYGGLWEAGVRSVKTHLMRVNGTTKLTFEEMTTLLTQIEACLNSRPIYQMDDSETIQPLTPGHFLIGEPLVSVPDVNYEQRNINLLTRWQLIQRLTQEFWRRWRLEYLNTLQQRYKWKVTIPSPSIGDVVVIKDDELPPTKWLIGRIIQIHTGSDNHVRVVTVKTKNKEFTRPLSKLVFLPKMPKEH